MENGMFNISTLLEKYIVYIPEIQRDYAQGRNNKVAESVRSKLLDEIYDVLSGKRPQLVLNYIYGVPDPEEGEKSKIILIDGQQRVTTLFLLKWYLAVKSRETELSFLDDLSYATRESSREFCEFLGKQSLCIEGDGKPSDNIANHPKFKKRWFNDPTVFNMLNMLDAIDKKIRDGDEKCKGGSLDFGLFYLNLDNIKFSFISLDGFRRTEELYAAMNSRGKQLTPFELIKGKLLQADKELAPVINGQWLPDFWEISKKYVNEGEYVEKYASEHHDSFLYNYYSFIIQMIWFMNDKHKLGKKELLPSIATMTDDVIADKENIELIRYAMSLARRETEGTFQSYNFDEILRDKGKPLLEADNKNKVVIFDGTGNESVDFFKLCCFSGKDFTQAAKCYLWAYVRYRFDSKENRIIDDRRLVDYYLLMRALFMHVASNGTPTSVDKLSLNEEDLWKVIQPFEEIITKKEVGQDGKYKYQSQYDAFYSNSPLHYRILNNSFVRGATDNIGTITDEDILLAYNLDFILEIEEKDYFKCFVSYGFDQFRCGDDNRVFLPVKKKVITSLLSLRNWNSSDDFKKFLESLKTERFDSALDSVSDIEFEPSEWQYYVSEYPSFREGAYGQFYIPGSDENECNAEMSFDAMYIENERATKHKTRNPFIYEIYKASIDKRKIVKDMKYSDFVDKYELSFEKKEDGNFVWSYCDKTKKTYETHKTDYSEDCIEDFLPVFFDFLNKLEI